jgi:hypothetical protein
VKALGGGLVHVAGANGGHHRKPAHGVQPGADDAAVDAVVAVVAHQFGPHVNAGSDQAGRERDHTQAQGLVENNFLLPKLAQTLDELVLKHNGGDIGGD